MSMNLIQPDIELMRERYNEALSMLGVPAKYQFPNIAGSNVQGEPEIDNYSFPEDTFIFFDGNPKIKTFKRLGWVVENDENLPFLIHCSFNLKNLQKDCIFELSGQYTTLPSRKFRVTELTTDIQAPDHVTCAVVPCYDKQTVGYTKKEVQQKYNKSNNFLKPNVDYRGDYIDQRKGDK